MESYPAEVLVGVFPLVFCVDATLTSNGSDDNPSSSPSRSQFDRFLDAMAASLLEEPEGSTRLFSQDDSLTSSSTGRNKAVDDNTVMGLFGGDTGIDSDHEDDIILAGGPFPNNPGTSGISSVPSMDGSVFGDFDIRRNRSFGAMSFLGNHGSGRSGNNHSARSKDSKAAGGLDTSFAKALQDGQGFFQRARIVSISARHGFPPSKDPTGKENRIREFFLGKSLRTAKILSSTKKRPIDGILPSGWLEKHAAALPSVIIVVAEVSSHQNQHQQDALLQETMKSLQMSLASKRQCSIHVVGLVQEGISKIMSEQWGQTLAQNLESNPTLTLLDAADLEQDAAPSVTLRGLHQMVHDASLRYYMKQARRTKHKLFELGSARATPLLLPLCIRYCFKVAMFYEFQWLPEKSLKYMVEAYRHVETYYRYLLQQREIGNTGETDDSGQNDGPRIRVSNQQRRTPGGDATEGVEIALQSEDDISNLLLNPPQVPDDMILQCRVLADWLNFKILQSGFTSHTAGGLVAASLQLQKHTQAFCNPRRSFFCLPENAYVDWSFLTSQRMVVSQLLERNPPKVLGELGSDSDEIILRCSPWLAYQSAGEALLRLGAEIERAGKIINNSRNNDVDDMRSRYVGGLDKDGFEPKLKEEMKQNHKERALDCFQRALALYEREIEKSLNKTPAPAIPWKRSGVRLYYLVAGILVGLGRSEEAVPHLLKAIRLCNQWKDLELKLRKLLLACYNHIVTPPSDLGANGGFSVLLQSCFFTNLSITDLSTVLSKIASANNGTNIQWHEDVIEESNPSVPFSFVVTFPSRTHTTAGDNVTANLVLKSNLPYSIHLKSLVLQTLAGNMDVKPSELLSAKNANEAGRGTIIVQPKAEIMLSTTMKLPKDLATISSDQNEGEKDSPVAYGPVPKNARPRTGGLTAAAGARFVSQTDYGRDPESDDFQWGLESLGGKPFRCDGLSLVFSLVAPTTEQAQPDLIEFSMAKKSPEKDPNVKRTSFEVYNYLSSSWQRDPGLPLDLGPRCLRVLPPVPNMTLTNISEKYTNGKVLEGTVNRIILRLEAGQEERCKDICISVSSSSKLTSNEDGKTRIIASEKEDEDENEIIDPSDTRVRMPILVRKDEKQLGAMTEAGFQIPAGWSIASGNGFGKETEEYIPVGDPLNCGDVTYAAFEVFRPSPSVVTIEGVEMDDSEWDPFQHSICRSDIQVSIRYRQERVPKKDKHLATKVRGRRKTEEGSSSEGEDVSDTVYLRESFPLTWTAPIGVTFSTGSKESLPSGNRHPQNTASESNNARNLSLNSVQTELILVDGDRVSTRCILEPKAASDGLDVGVNSVRYKDEFDENSPCNFKLLSGKDSEGLLYQTTANHVTGLKKGSKFSVAWMNEVNMMSEYRKGSVSTSLGSLAVEWLPSALPSPAEVQNHSRSTFHTHGPLSPDGPLTCVFKGPPCYVENAPFETTMKELPVSVKLSIPFEVNYLVKNKTPNDQILNVMVRAEDSGEPGIVFFGLTKGEIAVGPHETYVLSYTALPLRAGKVNVPSVSLSSARYQTWIINQSATSLFVNP